MLLRAAVYLRWRFFMIQIRCFDAATAATLIYHVDVSAACRRHAIAADTLSLMPPCCFSLILAAAHIFRRALYALMLPD